jgi:pimeloyl-ACP methyl ester carboxylesterase
MSSRQSNGTDRVRSHKAASGDRKQPLADWTGGLPVFIPQGYEAGYDYPLLVWLSDPLGPAVDLGRCMARVSLRNFVAVEAAGGATAVWQAVDRVTDRLSIHPRRIWLVGQDAAGTEAFRIACRHPESFAGVVSLGGGFPLDESLFARIDIVRRMPMLYCCTAAEATGEANQTDRMLRLFHAAGATLAMRIYPRRRDLAATALADVNRWLMDEICGPASVTRAAVAG